MSARLRLLSLSLLLLTLAVVGGLIFARAVVVPALESAHLEGIRNEEMRAWELLVRLHERAARSAASDPELVAFAATAGSDEQRLAAPGALVDRLSRSYGVELLEVAVDASNPVPIVSAGDRAAAPRGAVVERPLFGVSDGGFRQDRNGVFLLTAAHRIGDDRIVLASFRLGSLLEAFVASGTGRRAAILVDQRGQSAAIADPDAILDDPVLQVSAVRSAWPLVDHAGRTIATIVSASTDSPLAKVVWRLELTGAAIAIGVLVLLGGVLVRGFALEFGRIESIVSSFTSLAKGNDDGRVHVVGEDEAGRLAVSLGEVRRRELVAQTLEISRRRQRKRQDRFLRGQLTALAATLEGAERDELLANIARLDEAARVASNDNRGDGEFEGSGSVAVGEDVAGRNLGRSERRRADRGEDAGPGEVLGHLLRMQSAANQDDFALLAIALENLAFRIRDNSMQMKSLLSELQEALRSRSEFQLLQQELDIARQLQRSILPADRPRPDGVGVHGLMLPARNVGGDFYDVLEMPDGRVAVIVADVSGKGVPAAFFAMITRTLVKATGASVSSPAEILKRVNDILSDENEHQMFVTCFLAIVRPDGHVEYVNSGHNPPFILRAGGDLEILKGVNDLALAVLSDYDFTTRTTRLAPGDLMLLYTDGVTEACNTELIEYGEDRLAADMLRLRDTPTFMVPRALANAVETFENGADQADDVTLVAVGFQRS